MNNPRLLTAVILSLLLGRGVCAAVSEPEIISLDEIFRSAETAGIQLHPSSAAVDEAIKGVRVARTQRLPDIQASVSLSFIGDGFTVKRDFSDYQKAPIPHFGSGLSINVSQPVYTGGAITTGIEMAELKTTAARFAEDFARDNLRFRLAGYYLDLYKFSNLRKVVAENIHTAEKVLDEMKARYEHGTVLKNDITRYELLVSNLRLEEVKIGNTIEILNDNLVELSGLAPGTVVRPDSTILESAMLSGDAAWWQEEAMENSPMLNLERNGVAMSRKAEELEKSARRPKIGLQAGWTIDGPILVEIPPINRNLSYWWVGVGVSYNIGSLYKSNKALAKSRAATRLSQFKLDNATQELQLQMRDGYIRYREAFEELATCTKSVQLAEANYTTVSTRFSEDMALITDMLDAANSRLDAELRLVNAKINIIYSYYKLLFTAGKI